MEEGKQLSQSRRLAAKLIYNALRILKDAGGELSGREVMQNIENSIELDAYAKERYEKSGYIRWQSILHFYTIGCTKAGYLVKKKGTWILTPEGEKAFELGEIKLFFAIADAYKKWAEKNKKEIPSDNEEGEEETDISQSIVLEEVEQKAKEGLKNYIDLKNPYEFQDLVAILLQSMGYYTPYVAPRGKDGGIDIIAYQDPLGTKAPRIKVQVKRRESTASVHEVRQLMGLLSKDGDVGIFVSTGGFTKDAIDTARSSPVHVELIDFDRFIELWQEFYEKIPDEDKAKLPLYPIYFLAPNE